MRNFSQGRFQQQFRFLRRQFLQDSDLPLSNVLSNEIVMQAMTAIEGCWLDRVYSPLVTLWVFLGQVLSQDHSCRAAVARLIAHRVSRGQHPCSAETSAYCQARKRLPEEFFQWNHRVSRERYFLLGRECGVNPGLRQGHLTQEIAHGVAILTLIQTTKP